MMTVLLIEDDESFRTTLALALRRRGCEVLQAANAAEALHLLEQAPTTEGIVLDMRLGQDNGNALIPELRRLSPQARLIILTGYGSIPNAIEAVRLGADDYLLKPAGADQVLAALRGHAAESPRPGAGDLPSLARLEWEHIQRVLSDCQGNISHTAEALGIDRRTLQRKLMKMPPEV
ncbi:two-component system, response regulator RegA [Prosthecobacter debontii]|uniref:Two-component system, response regulator RegA n=1 Tax=Prosthecobacter debontii TaxID=48467 RepID=A0A1T4WLH9_9BACT|nr:response regulator [Prosthecobacter debontii]SKA78193.1 two-component system, response regulator RegA [Prosthecobacter debontii]